MIHDSCSVVRDILALVSRAGGSFRHAPGAFAFVPGDYSRQVLGNRHVCPK